MSTNSNGFDPATRLDRGKRSLAGHPVVEQSMYISPGVETRVLEKLAAMVKSLPLGTAELQLGENPSPKNKNLFPYFRITPRNPRSATIEGHIYEGQGIDFTIGQSTGGDIYVSPKNKKGSAGEDRFFRICEAVFRTQFSEKLIYNARGRVIWSQIILDIDGRKTRLGGHQVFWWFSPRRSTKHFSYEPYFQPQANI